MENYALTLGCNIDNGMESSNPAHQDSSSGLDSELDTKLENDQYKLPPLISDRSPPDDILPVPSAHTPEHL